MQRHWIKIVNVPVEKRYAEKMIADVPGNVLRGCGRFSASSGAPGGWGPYLAKISLTTMENHRLFGNLVVGMFSLGPVDGSIYIYIYIYIYLYIYIYIYKVLYGIIRQRKEQV